MIGLARVITLVLAVAALSTGYDELPDGLKIVNPFVCKPGSHFKIDCNSCSCVPEGGEVGACTRMACPLQQDECIPGSYFQIKGQLCPCPETRYKWDSDCFGI